MRRLFILLGAFALLVTLSNPRPAYACPSCKEAIEASGAEQDDDPFREGRAYNNAIYLMVTMPYLALGVFGFLIYRGLRKKPHPGAAAAGEPEAGGGKDQPCPRPSPDVTS